MKVLVLALSVLLAACAAPTVEPSPLPEPTPQASATPSPAPQIAAGQDPNVWTAKFAAALCTGDAQGLYDSLANGASPKESLNGEADYYADLVDEQTASAAALIAEVGAETNTDVTAMLAALDAKAKDLKAQNSPVAILAAEIKLSDGTTCALTFKGSFTDRYGSYNAIYVITFSRADGTSDEGFYLLTAGNGGVEDIN